MYEDNLKHIIQISSLEKQNILSPFTDTQIEVMKAIKEQCHLLKYYEDYYKSACPEYF